MSDRRAHFILTQEFPGLQEQRNSGSKDVSETYLKTHPQRTVVKHLQRWEARPWDA